MLVGARDRVDHRMLDVVLPEMWIFVELLDQVLLQRYLAAMLVVGPEETQITSTALGTAPVQFG